MNRKAALVVGLLAFTALTLFRAPYPHDQLLQHAPLVVVAPLLFMAARRRWLGDTAFGCVLLFLALHAIGARWVQPASFGNSRARRVAGVAISASALLERGVRPRLRRASLISRLRLGRDEPPRDESAAVTNARHAATALPPQSPRELPNDAGSSMVPYDAWSRDLLGFSVSARFDLSRNHYDRLVHAAFGVLAVPVVTDLAERHGGLSRGAAVFGAFLFVGALSAVYEVFEWGLTMTAATGDGGQVQRAAGRPLGRAEGHGAGTRRRRSVVPVAADPPSRGSDMRHVPRPPPSRCREDVPWTRHF